MAAASSGDPGGSTQGQWPGLGNSTNGFGGLTYLQLIPKDDSRPLPDDPFIVGISVEKAAGGPIEGASTEARGTRYMLKVRSQVQADRLLKLSMLMDGTEVIIREHPTLNISRCVISCFELTRLEEKTILERLGNQGVIRVQRITRKENGTPINTAALILTFNRCNYPLHVKVGLLRVTTRPYYPNPLLCYGCARFGHPRIRCPGPKRCLNCSNEHELSEDEECTSAAHCINCGGPHRPNNRQCPVFKKEVEVVRVKVDHNLTFPEARKRVEAGIGSYAAAAAHQSAASKRIEELMKKMEEKNAEIARLSQEMKKKEERFEKLHALYKHQLQLSMPSQTIQQSQALPAEFTHQQRIAKQFGDSQIPGPSMQLRNRSPAIVPPKPSENGKKNKRHNRSNHTSPGRQSPPPKKVNEKTSINQETANADENEFGETSLKHVR